MTEAAVDPTAIPIQYDPREQRMVGVAIHGDTPFDVPFISEIAPGLWLGGCEDGLICPANIDRVLSLAPWFRYELGSHQERQELEFYDSDLPDVDHVDAAADLVAAWRHAGHTVLVHCQAGLNRSSLVMATYLIKHCRMTPDGAIALLRAKRSPAVLCNRNFESYLLDL